MYGTIETDGEELSTQGYDWMDARIELYPDGTPEPVCSLCGETESEHDDEVCPQDEDETPEFQVPPLSWANWASVEADTEKDRVVVSISTGDPRGSLSMSVERLPDGRLILHVPYAEHPLPHEDLTRLSEGTYLIREG